MDSSQEIIRTSWIGIAANVLLAGFKAAVGILASSGHRIRPNRHRGAPLKISQNHIHSQGEVWINYLAAQNKKKTK